MPLSLALAERLANVYGVGLDALTRPRAAIEKLIEAKASSWESGR